MMSRSTYYENRDRSFLTGISLRVRQRILRAFVDRFGNAAKIVDVGATSERESPEANFLERFFPHKDRITAVGIEDASFLETVYPGMRFVRVEAGRPLPFADDAFDVAFSHAVIEHVVEESARRLFINELMRVARVAFITTPNKYFPIEPHTMVPFLHFVAPRLFYYLLDRKIMSRSYDRTNLRLLSKRDLQHLVRALDFDDAQIDSVRLFGLTSNWIVTIRRPSRVRAG